MFKLFWKDICQYFYSESKFSFYVRGIIYWMNLWGSKLKFLYWQLQMPTAHFLIDSTSRPWNSTWDIPTRFPYSGFWLENWWLKQMEAMEHGGSRSQNTEFLWTPHSTARARVQGQQQQQQRDKPHHQFSVVSSVLSHQTKLWPNLDNALVAV